MGERTKTGFKPTKEMLLSGENFYSNKGKLPWPVEKGEITERFGKNPHPLHANVFTYNNGVDISTVTGANVRAIYTGEVTSVLIIPSILLNLISGPQKHPSAKTAISIDYDLN